MSPTVIIISTNVNFFGGVTFWCIWSVLPIKRTQKSYSPYIEILFFVDFYTFQNNLPLRWTTKKSHGKFDMSAIFPKKSKNTIFVKKKTQFSLRHVNPKSIEKITKIPKNKRKRSFQGFTSSIWRQNFTKNVISYDFYSILLLCFLK